MEILEVAENVAQYLDKKDKAACLHVCKTWYRHILSSLYHTVEAPYNSVLSLEALLLHGHRIRHLNLGRHLVSHFHPQLEFYSHHRNLIPNLTELTISLSAIQRDDDRYAWLAVFIAVVNSGRKLRKLTLEDEKQNPSPRPCWTYLFSQFDPHQTVLEELKLRYIYLNDEEETRLMLSKFAATLRVLDVSFCGLLPRLLSTEAAAATAAALSNVSQHQPTPRRPPPLFPQMRKISLWSACPTLLHELDWIVQCPNLEILQYHGKTPSPYPSERWAICDRLRERPSFPVSDQGQLYDGQKHDATERSPGVEPFIPQQPRYTWWPYLQELDFCCLNYKNGHMSDSEMADFLNCCPPLKVLRMNNSGFWYRSLDALETRGHVRSLETLSLRCSPDVQPWMVQWILCCSPRLRSLQCDYMAAHEMVQDITEEKVDTETESSLLVMSAREAQRRQSEVDRAADLKKITQEIEQHQHRFPSELNAIMHRYNSRRQRHLDRVRSWVCLDLECLETIIWFENDNARSVVEKDSATSPLFETATAGQGQGQYQRARIGPTIWDVQVLNQLAQLKSLKRLVLSQYRVMDQNRQRGIRLKLPYLGHLSTLTSLQRLTLSATKSGNMDHILDELEVRWMMEHWPRIKAIASRFRVQAGYSEILSAEEKIREDGRIRDELSQLAGSRGIQLYLWKPF